MSDNIGKDIEDITVRELLRDIEPVLAAGHIAEVCFLNPDGAPVIYLITRVTPEQSDRLHAERRSRSN